jgi:hypothetical protein
MTRITGTIAGWIAITAAEGGTGYWGRMDEYHPSAWYPDGSDEPVNVPDTFAFYVLRADDDDDGTYAGDPIAVTPALIRRGYRLALAQYPHVLDSDGPEYVDADGADVIIQLGAWGEVIYG